MTYFKERLGGVRESLGDIWLFIREGTDSKNLSADTRSGLVDAHNLLCLITKDDKPYLEQRGIYIPKTLRKTIELTTGMLKADGNKRAERLTKPHIQAGIDACLLYCQIVEKIHPSYLALKHVELMDEQVNGRQTNTLSALQKIYRRRNP